MSKKTNSRKPQSNKKDYRNKSNRRQPRKDSPSKRVNFDNTRVDKFEKDEAKYVHNTGQRPNDISWYSKNPELVKAACSYPFASIIGDPITGVFHGVSDTVSNIKYKNGGRIPGIMSILYNHSLIDGSAVKDVAVEQAFNSMYSYIVHANSRNYNYTAADLGILTLAGMEVFTSIAEVLRVFGVIRYYEEQSRYVPDSLMSALGFDPEDMRKNQPFMWFDINAMIDRTRSIWIPTTMPLLKRWMWLVSNIFADDDSRLPQLYLFRPLSYYQYSETRVSTGSALLHMGYHDPGELRKWNDMKALINRQIEALMQSEDRGIIYGDLLNAYGKENIFALPPITADYAVRPVFNPEVLTQIENLTITGLAPNAGIIQDGNGSVRALKYAQTVGAVGSYLNFTDNDIPETPLINFHQVAQPTPEQIMIATRLTASKCESRNCDTVSAKVDPDLTTPLTSTKSTVNVPIASGTETVYGIVLYNTVEPVALNSTNALFSDKDGGANTYRQKPLDFDAANAIVVNGYPQVAIPQTAFTAAPTVLIANKLYSAAAALAAMQFIQTWIQSYDWHPVIYSLVVADAHAPASYDNTPISAFRGQFNLLGFDAANYSTLSSDELAKMHYVALFSELGVPQI